MISGEDPSSHVLRPNSSSRPHWWAILSVAIALLALVTAVSGTRDEHRDGTASRALLGTRSTDPDGGSRVDSPQRVNEPIPSLSQASPTTTSQPRVLLPKTGPTNP